MKKLPFNILKLINSSLIVFWAISVYLFVIFYQGTIFWKYAAIISFLYLVLFFDTFFLLRNLEWSRKVFVGVNAALAIYIFVLSWYFPGYIHLGYMLISVILVLFYEMKRIRVIYQKNWDNLRQSILVVDDDEGLQKTLKRILLSNGYSVLSAMTGERGIQVAKVQQPQLIILDVLLPGMKGREVCRILKSTPETKAIPVIFLTSKNSPDDIEAEKAAGAVLHLTKPVQAKILIEEIHKIIG